MTREDAEVEVERRRAAEPGATWTTTRRDGEWHVARIALAPRRAEGTATKPPPRTPQPDPRGGEINSNWGLT